MEEKELIKLEEDWCWYLKKLLENDDLNYSMSEMGYKISDKLDDINAKLIHSNDYKQLKKVILNDYFITTAFALGLSTVCDLVINGEITGDLIYAIALVYPAILAPIKYYKYKRDFKNYWEPKIPVLLSEKENYEYIEDIHLEKLNQIEENGLIEEEFKDFDDIERKLMRLKRF